MVCAACGAPVAAGVNFCARCGAGVAAAPEPVYAGQNTPVAAHSSPLSVPYGVPYAPRPRVQRNLQTLGILWCVYAAYRVLAGLVGMLVLHAFSMRSLGEDVGRDGSARWINRYKLRISVFTGCHPEQM